MQGLRKYLLVFALIGIIAAFEAPAKLIPVTYYYYGESSSPLNTSKFGTSTLVSLLRGEGYVVKVVDSQAELDAFLSATRGNFSRLIYVMVSPDKHSQLAISSFLSGDFPGGKDVPISVLVADEPVGSVETNEAVLMKVSSPTDVVIYSFWSACGLPTDNIIVLRPVDYVLQQIDLNPGIKDGLVKLKDGSYVLVEYVSPENESVEVFMTAYVGVLVYVDTSGETPEPRLLSTGNSSLPVPLKQAIPGFQTSSSNSYYIRGEVNGYILLSTGSLPAYSYTLECRPYKGFPSLDYRLIVAADGTPFTNLALNQGGAYEEYVQNVFNWLSGDSNPNETLIIFDNTVYESRGPLGGGENKTGLPQSLSFAIRFHPAFLLLEAVRVFASLDASLALRMNRDPLILAGVITVFTLLAFYTFRSSLFRGKPIGEKELEPTVGPEVLWYAFTPEEVKLSRDEYRVMAVRLCGLVEKYYKKTYGTSLLEDSIVLDKRSLQSRLGISIETYNYFREACKKASEPGFWDRHFTNWGKKFQSLASTTEKILEHLGYTLEGRKGKRGIEYG
ncbi:MAG: hypothetical protein F7C32_02980 [Desulfurococcales archaeon]|nr:hypothetical protein [Desulfurococcales archaeon]